MAALVTILLIVNAVTYSISKQVMEHQFGLAAQSMAVAISQVISEDLDSYRNFLSTRDTSSEYYRHMQSYFGEIKKASNIRFIYTVNQLDDTYIEFILDSEPIGSQYHSNPGDTKIMTDASRQVFMTKQPTMRKPSVSYLGTLLGGNAPILDEQNNLLGAVVVSIDNSMVFSTIQQLFFVLGGACVILLVFIFFLLSKVSHFFLEAILRDKLTSAYNKRYFESMLQKSMDVAIKTNQNLSVLMVDLDYFKNINDTYGHPFGDIVLAKVSGLIRECLRKDDFFVRYGGEEFVILLFNLGSDITIMLAERIRKAIESFEIYNEEKNLGIHMTISIGVANMGKKRMFASELVSNADKALYKAKITRNAVAVFTG
jgi:diguanylate cyclase (GGDEF)-like protein